MIDESAGILDRKDTVVNSSAKSYALATLLSGPRELASTHPNTIKAMVRLGWIDRRPWPERGEWAYRYHLTDAGRATALASTAVAEWLVGWKLAATGDTP